MKWVVSIDQDTVLELCVRPREATDGEATEDTAGFAADVPGLSAGGEPVLQLPDQLQGYRLAVIPLPHRGPPVQAPEQDAQGSVSNDQESQRVPSDQRAALDPAAHLTPPDPAAVDAQDAQGFLWVLIPRLVGAPGAGAGAGNDRDDLFDAAYGTPDYYANQANRDTDVFKSNYSSGKP